MPKSRLWKLIIAPFLIGPVVYLLVYSIAGSWVYPLLFPEWTLTHWKHLLTGSNELLGSTGLSLLMSTIMASVSTVLAFFTSRYISLSRNAIFWQNLAYLPFALSPIVYAVCIHFYFNYLELSASVAGVMLAQLFLLYPYSVILFSTFWNKQVHEYQKMVATLGGNSLMQWKHGIWPFAKAVVAFSWVQTFLISWFDFGMTQYIGVGKVKTLTIQVFQLVSEASPYLAAVSGCLLVIPPFILFYVNKKFLINSAFSGQ